VTSSFHTNAIFILVQNPVTTFWLPHSVGSFRYLGRVESCTDSDWAALCANLRRDHYKWCKLSKLLTGEGANPRIFGVFYKAVLQSVLLFGCESWTMTDAMWNALKGFHHWAARRMAKMMACRGPGGVWIYPPLEEALKEAGLYTMEHRVTKRQQRVVDYISTRPIWMHCIAASKRPGTPTRMRRCSSGPSSVTRVSFLWNWLSLFGSNPQLCQLLSTTLAVLDLFIWSFDSSLFPIR